MHIRSLLIVSLVVGLAACSGKKGPTEPDPIDNNGCFAIVGNHGTVTATIAGLPAFSGTIPNGNAVLNPPSSGIPGFFNVQGTDTRTGTSVLVSGPMTLGPTSASLASPGEGFVQILVTTRSCERGTGNWIGNFASGSATVVVATASATGVSGSFTGTLEAGAGSGAVGSKTISGTFNATF